MTTNWLPEIVRRSQSGPYMKDKDFDMTLARKVMELVRKYDIRFDRHVLVPSDDDLADRVWRAGLELFLEVGVYNMSTSRVIKFSPEEVEEGKFSEDVV